MSSLKVVKQAEFQVPGYGGDDCVVVVYQHADFTGWSAVYGEGDHEYNDFMAAGAVNDDASSIKVRGKDCMVTIH